MKKNISNVKEKFKKYKILVQNFSYLSLLRISDMLIPLITYPYLIRVLGKDIYGLVIFAQTIIGFLVMLVEFGFNLTATQEISINRDNKIKLGVIVSSVLIIKFILFIISFVILSGMIFFISRAHEYQILFYLTMWMCLSNVILPTWYFQGIEKMKYIALLNVISKLFFLIAILFIVKSPNDFLYVPLINGLGVIITGIISLYIIFYRHNINFSFPKLNVIQSYFKESLFIFFSNISIQFYVNFNKIIIGLLLGMKEVAYFDLAEKITSILKMPFLILGQAIYPKIAKEKNKNFLKKMFIASIGFSLILVFVSILLSEKIIILLGGVDMLAAAPVVKILIFSVIPIIISLFFANLLLITWGYKKEYFKLRLFANFIYFCIIGGIYMANLININSLAVSYLIIETLTAVIAVFMANRNRINFLYK